MLSWQMHIHVPMQKVQLVQQHEVDVRTLHVIAAAVAIVET